MPDPNARDYSRLPITELTAQLEDALFRHTDLVETDPEFGGLLAGIHRIWSTAVADHPDPVGALIHEVEESGGFPRFVDNQVFNDEVGGIDILSLLVVVSMRRTGKGGHSGTGDLGEPL